MASELTLPAQIAHNFPGRLRLRFEQAGDADRLSVRLGEAGDQARGILGVEVRPASRSAVIRYDPAQVDPDRLIRDVLPAAGVRWPQERGYGPVPGGNMTQVGQRITDAVGRVNRGVGRVTRGVIDVRDIFPLTLLAFGFRRVARGPIQAVPWYNLLYYGYSTFFALHRGRADSGPDAKETLRRRYVREEISREEFQEMMENLNRYR